MGVVVSVTTTECLGVVVTRGGRDWGKLWATPVWSAAFWDVAPRGVVDTSRQIVLHPDDGDGKNSSENGIILYQATRRNMGRDTWSYSPAWEAKMCSGGIRTIDVRDMKQECQACIAGCRAKPCTLFRTVACAFTKRVLVGGGGRQEFDIFNQHNW
jgi:hypothetical protein